MSGTPLSRCRGLTLAFVILLAGVPAAAVAQRDSTAVLRATLRGWEDDARLAIFDRSGSYHGRFSDRGILQRFTERLDQEYTIDQISFGFSMVEDYAWYLDRKGARWWGGSINHRFLVQRAEIGGTVPLGETWDFNALLSQEATLQTDRAVVRATFRKSFDDGRVVAFATGFLKADKPEMDLELGASFRPGSGTVTVAVAALDLFSNLIYGSLQVPPRDADRILDYSTKPYTLRIAADLPVGRFFRGEVYGLYTLPASLTATAQHDTVSSFAQDERYAYVGGMFEWTPSAKTAVGALATWLGGDLDRTSLDDTPSLDDFNLAERNAHVGVYLIQRFRTRWLFETRVVRQWRTESRIRPDTAVASEIDYADRAWLGRTTMTYQARSGFRGELGLDFALRDVVRDADLPGDFQGRRNTRLRFDLGWYFGRTAMFVLGTNADLDQDAGTATGWFDGGHARFQVFW
jgi:hypothetical protein